VATVALAEDEEEEEVDAVEEEDLVLPEVTPTTPHSPKETTPLKEETKTPTTVKPPNPILVPLPKEGIEDHSDEEEEEEETEEEPMLEARALRKELLIRLKLEDKADPTLVDPQEKDAPEVASTTANAILPRMTAALLLPRPFSWPTSRSLWMTRVSTLSSRI